MKSLCIIAAIMSLSVSAPAEELFPSRKPIAFEFGRSLQKDDTIGGYPIWQGDGRWQLIHLETDSSPTIEKHTGSPLSKTPLGKAYFIQVEQGRLTASMEVWGNLTAGPGEYWNMEPCKNETVLWKRALSDHFTDISCVLIGHTTGFQYSPILKPYLAKLQQNKIDLPPTVVSVVVVRAGANSRRLDVYIHINPELFGFPRDSQGWSDSPWHKDNVLKDPTRKQFVDGLAKWAEIFATRASGPAFRRDMKAFDDMPSLRSMNVKGYVFHDHTPGPLGLQGSMVASRAASGWARERPVK